MIHSLTLPFILIFLFSALAKRKILVFVKASFIHNSNSYLFTKLPKIGHIYCQISDLGHRLFKILSAHKVYNYVKENGNRCHALGRDPSGGIRQQSSRGF